jgi:hypothetical protein
MSAQVKNIVIGPATVSFGGSDIGAIKRGGVKVIPTLEHVEIGNNENMSGIEAHYRRFQKVVVQFIAEEASLANIKAAIGGAGTVGSANPATFGEEFTEGIMTAATLLITGAAPRTSVGVAQTRTITMTCNPTAKTIEMVLSGAQITEIPFEFTAIKVSGASNDFAISDVNA